MPKPISHVKIRLDLLKPQSNPEKIPVALLKWLLSSGRYIFIVVEALVLIAFISRFKLDADIQSKKEAIDQQIPYIQNLKQYEILIKQTQLQLSTIGTFKQSSADYSNILKKIADQTPFGVKINSLVLNMQVSGINIQINGQAQTNNDVSVFISGLRNDANFTDVNLASIGIERGVLHFTSNLIFKPVSISKSL